MTRDVTYQLTAAQIAARKAARQRQLAAQRQRLAEQRAAAAQRQAAQRQAAIERAAVAKQNFINQSAAIPYAELIKSTAPYVGKKIALHGQIFQIQQGGQGGVMLLSVDNTYGIWTDHVWVDYDTNNPYVQGNIVTVYGTVTGTKSYVSQAGYNIYVPEVHARYTESG